MTVKTGKSGKLGETKSASEAEWVLFPNKQPGPRLTEAGTMREGDWNRGCKIREAAGSSPPPPPPLPVPVLVEEYLDGISVG